MASRCSWDLVRPALGLAAGGALPARCRCPLCRADGGLGVYDPADSDDTAGRGPWHHCRACGARGDLLSLCRAAWACSAAEALSRLGLAATAAELDAYEAAAGAGSPAAAFDAFWAAARDRWPAAAGSAGYAPGGPLRAAALDNGLVLDAGVQRWADGPGRLVGATTAGDVKALAGRGAVAGTGWKDRTYVAVAPAWALPGLPCGLACLAEGGRRPGDEAYVPLPGFAAGGLSGVESIAMAGDPADVLAVDDWLLAVHVQCRTMRTTLRPLPLVAWRPDGRYATAAGAWACVGGRRVVFWASKLAAEVVARAAELDGLVALAGPAVVRPTTRDVERFLFDAPGQGLYRRLIRKARPWSAVLAAWLAVAEGGAAVDLVRRLEEMGADVSYVLRRAGRSAPAGWSLPAVAAPKKVRIKGATVVEQAGRWVAEPDRNHGRAGRRSEVCNAVLRLTHAVKDRRSGEVYYLGYVLKDDRRCRFVERVQTVRDKPAAVMAAALEAAGGGVLNAARGYDLHQIAVLFREPRFVTDDLYKWVEKMRLAGEDGDVFDGGRGRPEPRRTPDTLEEVDRNDE